MRRVHAVLAGAALIGVYASAVPVVSVANAADIGSIRSACAAIGLYPGEAPFAYCVQSLAKSAVPRSYAMNGPTPMTDAGGYGAPHYGSRSENACAAVGLNPATARYSYCVSNLRQTLFDEQNIMAR